MQFNCFRFLFIFCLTFGSIFAQELTQTFRGVIIDKQTQNPLPGAVVVIPDVSKQITADENGKFNISGLPIGRNKVKIVFTGYNEKSFTIDLTSGKQLVLTIELEESVNEMNEVTVVAETDKTKTNNKTTTVSARKFSIEDAQRYAGSRNDPARMAANFAGVSGANDSRNDIIVRGNSPLGVLWRLNGMDIPNPSHFGSLGSTGGPISILNSNTLDNSDFLSGAFPAEYGNATAGVFDLRMRPGNNEKYEFLGQVGFNGFEFGAEGPFSKKNKNASFLVNYRYSTLQVFKYLGINFGTGSAVPQYQDMTFHAVLPTKRFGKFQFYGVGGVSYVSLLQKDLDDSENLYGYSGEDRWFTSDMGAAGMSHTYLINNSSYTKLNLVTTYQANEIRVDKVDTFFSPDKVTPFYRNRSSNKKAGINFSYHKKFSSKNNISSGIVMET
ncbi:MAG: carboxypeptidase-like regulatory domain-containing protein, partial [Bacteroidota bacterium]